MASTPSNTYLPILRFFTTYGYNDLYFASENDAIHACILLSDLGLGLTYRKGLPMIVTLTQTSKYNEIKTILKKAGLC
jgi:hypothetical protein